MFYLKKGLLFRGSNHVGRNKHDHVWYILQGEAPTIVISRGDQTSIDVGVTVTTPGVLIYKANYRGPII